MVFIPMGVRLKYIIVKYIFLVGMPAKGSNSIPMMKLTVPSWLKIYMMGAMDPILGILHCLMEI